MARTFFYRETHGIRITVRPAFLSSQSRPEDQHFVFGYAVRVENVGTLPAQLLTRHWRIHDGIGLDSEVRGDGVVGEQPLIQPGHVHEYQSFCILQSGSGYMEGEYLFVRAGGVEFSASIPRFTLDAAESTGPTL